MKKEKKTGTMLDQYPYTEEMILIEKILVDDVETSDGFDKSLKNLGHVSNVKLNKMKLLEL